MLLPALLLGTVAGILPPGNIGPGSRVVVLRMHGAAAVPLDTQHQLDTLATQTLREHFPGVTVEGPGTAITVLTADGEAQLRALLEDPNALVDDGVLGMLNASHLLLRSLLVTGANTTLTVRLYATGNGRDVGRVQRVVPAAGGAALAAVQRELLGELLDGPKAPAAAGERATTGAAPASPPAAPTPPPVQAAPAAHAARDGGGRNPLMLGGAVAAWAVSAVTGVLALVGGGVGAVLWGALFVPALAVVLVPRFLAQGPRYAARVGAPVASHVVAGVLGLTCMALLAVGGAAGAAWWFMGREP